ncbi:MAG: serine/threonine-protein phosphatase [Ignavibacteriales bacterium]|nr:serine/threonine-protein phosphatase [Ignavibacteriales bacterium]
MGGDFYDYVWLDRKKTKLGLTLADVSGKAMKAAMTAVMTSGMLYSEALRNQSPREILARLNRPLYLRSDKRVFTALSFATVDLKTKNLTYSSAGQSQPLLIRNGMVSYIRTKGARLPLGVKQELEYKEITMRLRRGDTVVFYTDGVPEAMNNDNQLYGFERFESLTKENHGSTAKELRDAIVHDIRLFTKNVEQHDDTTVVVVKVQ